MSGCSAAASAIALLAVLGLADDVETLLREQRGEGVAGQRMVVDDQDAFGHVTLIGR